MKKIEIRRKWKKKSNYNVQNTNSNCLHFTKYRSIPLLTPMWWSAELHANTNSAMLVLIKSTYQETADVRTYVRTGGVGGPGAAPHRSAMSKYRYPTDEYWWFRRACHCLRWWLEFNAGVSMDIFNRLNPCLLQYCFFFVLSFCLFVKVCRQSRKTFLLLYCLFFLLFYYFISFPLSAFCDCSAIFHRISLIFGQLVDNNL